MNTIRVLLCQTAEKMQCLSARLFLPTCVKGVTCAGDLCEKGGTAGVLNVLHGLCAQKFSLIFVNHKQLMPSV